MDRVQLFEKWLQAKAREDKAKAERHDAEKAIEQLYDFSEMSQTVKCEGFKINIKKNIKYDLDQDLYSVLRLKVDPDMRPEKVKIELDTKKYNMLANLYPHIYKIVSDAVTIKFNKSTIKVEKEEQNENN